MTVSLPVAIASDTSPEARLDSIRIYHRVWPLLGFHLVRAPILPALALVLPDVVGRYHDCLGLLSEVRTYDDIEPPS